MTIDWKKDASRFAVFYENEEIGEISFVKTGEHLLIIDHTYVDAKWKGHAIGNALVQKVVDFAVADNRKSFRCALSPKKYLTERQNMKQCILNKNLLYPIKKHQQLDHHLPVLFV